MKTENSNNAPVDSKKTQELLVALELLAETDEIDSGIGLHFDYDYLNYDALKVYSLAITREFQPEYNKGLNFPEKSDIVHTLISGTTVFDAESDSKKIKTLLVALELLVEIQTVNREREFHVEHGYLDLNSIKLSVLSHIREFHGEELDFPGKKSIVNRFLNRRTKYLVLLRDFYRRPCVREKPKGPLLKDYHYIWLLSFTLGSCRS